MFDAETGKELWEFDVGALISIGGPSIGYGMLCYTIVLTGNMMEVAN